MRLGFQTTPLADLSLREVAEFADQVGYSVLQVQAWPPGKAERRYAGVCHADVDDILSEGGGERFMANFAGLNVVPGSFGYYVNPLDPDMEVGNEYLAHLDKVFRAAAAVGVRVSTFVGRDWRGTVDENWPTFLSVWRPVVERASKLGVRGVDIENCPMLFTADEAPYGKNLLTGPVTWRRAFTDITSPIFGVELDPSHHVFQDIDYVACVRMLAAMGRLGSVHLKDLKILKHKRAECGILALPPEYTEPCTPGFGDVDWASFFLALYGVGYQGDAYVEIEHRAFEGTVDAAKASLILAYRNMSRFVV